MLSNNALSQHTYSSKFLQIHVRNVVGRLKLDEYIQGVRPTVCSFCEPTCTVHFHVINCVSCVVRRGLLFVYPVARLLSCTKASPSRCKGMLETRNHAKP